MPVYVKAIMMPPNGAKWPLLDDGHVRGGLRVVKTHADKDSLYSESDSRLTLKVGCVVVVEEDRSSWMYIGTGQYVPWPTSSSSSYVHTQNDAAVEWVIYHGLDNDKFQAQVFVDGRLTWPRDLVSLDTNTVKVTFAAAVTGHVCFTFM